MLKGHDMMQLKLQWFIFSRAVDIRGSKSGLQRDVWVYMNRNYTFRDPFP